jgi:hypothetical protein
MESSQILKDYVNLSICVGELLPKQCFHRTLLTYTLGNVPGLYKYHLGDSFPVYKLLSTNAHTQCNSSTSTSQRLFSSIPLQHQLSNMPSLNDLPTDLINNISMSLDRANILAMCYVDRTLASTTTDAFFRSFTHIGVSCSAAGLRRLEALVQKQDTTQNIKHVTLHTLTFKDMVDMADMAGLVPEGEPNPSVRVCADMRKTLLRCLNLLPKLEVITATNELLSSNANDHFTGPGLSSELDSFYRTEFWRAVDDRHWSLDRDNSYSSDVPTYDRDILNENSI